VITVPGTSITVLYCTLVESNVKVTYTYYNKYRVKIPMNFQLHVQCVYLFCGKGTHYRTFILSTHPLQY